MQNRGNVKQESQAIVLLKCTGLNIYCISCTLLDSYLQLIFDFKLHRGADASALCCVLQPLLLWKCFPPATMQQSWVFVWTGFEELGKKKSPFSYTGLGMGMGKGCNASLAPLLWGQPHSQPQQGISVLACAQIGTYGRAQLSKFRHNLGIFLTWLPRSILHPSWAPAAPCRGGCTVNN